ncbi:MAG: UDP-N-acetylglucosamine 2-epimerase (hydrolyzing) [Proteobacteria bacterium]|nr:UDP-N-acetylglucosamine 2-epimerase (hydrolyzing) [Pseudomonadota bacterium]
MKKKICVFTGTRAEYGLLKRLLDDIKKDPDLCLQIVVSGTHLSREHGFTLSHIEADGFCADEKIDILMGADSSSGICKSIGLGLISYSDALKRLEPDMIVLLGDRFETFAMAATAMIMRVPIAHLHGGETTQGAIDEPMRHAITKMSQLHFTSTEEYRKRVIQLGENPDRVVNVGAIGTENIRKLDLMDKNTFEKKINFSLGIQSVLVTFHPVTLEKDTAGEQFGMVLNVLDEFDRLKIIFTKANADEGGMIINRMIDAYAEKRKEKAIAFASMGQRLYLSAMKHVNAVVGNSSSGIIETPSFKMPTVNIGDRQKGRIRAKNTIDCAVSEQAIRRALKTALSDTFVKSIQDLVNPYEKKDTVKTILKRLKDQDLTHILKKEFYDLDFNIN